MLNTTPIRTSKGLRPQYLVSDHYNRVKSSAAARDKNRYDRIRAENTRRRRPRLRDIQDVVNSSDELSSETRRKRRSARRIQDAIRRRNNRRSRAATRIQSSVRTLTPKTQRKMLSEIARQRALNQGVDPNTGYPISLEDAYIGLKPFEEARLGLQSRYGEPRPNIPLPEIHYDTLDTTPNTTPNTTSTQFYTGLGSNAGATSYAPLSALVKDLGLVANAVSEIAENVAENAGSALQSNEAQGLAMMAKDAGAALLSMFTPGGRRTVSLPTGARARYYDDGSTDFVPDDQDPSSRPGGGSRRRSRRSRRRTKRNKITKKR